MPLQQCGLIKIEFCYRFNVRKFLITIKDNAANGYEHTNCSGEIFKTGQSIVTKTYSCLQSNIAKC